MDGLGATWIPLVLALLWRRQRMAVDAHRIECVNAARLLRAPGLDPSERVFAEHYYNDAVLRYNKARASLPGKLLSATYCLERHAVRAGPDQRIARAEA